MSTNLTISHQFLKASKRPDNLTAFRFSDNGKWKSVTWPEYYKLSAQLAGCLASAGIKRGQKVAIMSNTCYQWAVSDMAILGLGCTTIPVYQNNTVEDVEFILNNSEASAVFLEDESQYAKIKQLKGKVPSLKVFVSFKDIKGAEDVYSWSDAQKKGAEYLLAHPGYFENEIQKNKLEDIATIVYTSGTTGQPKGAVILHSCIESECIDLMPILNVGTEDTTLTFLPFAHIFGRIEMFAHVYMGWQVVFAESIDRIAANLPIAKPTFMIAVPRVFEKIYSRILGQVDEGSAAKKKIFNWAVGLGRQVSQAKQQGKFPPLSVFLQYQIAHKLVFSKLHQRMGGRMEFLISGSAPLSKEIIEFFHAAGILILEGYGLTETTAGIYFNTPGKYVFGTVGLPIGEAQGKIAEDGEILLKGKKVFKEYYKNPEATREAFTADGWFQSGDIGEIDANGFLKITDRKKDMIKTAGGKMIAPQKIENLLKLNKLISQVAVFGDKQKYLVALITLNAEELTNYARTHGLAGDYTALTKLPQIRDVIRDIIKEKNATLASYETIKNFAILPEDFTIEKGEITPSLKVKRKAVGIKYENLVRELYS